MPIDPVLPHDLDDIHGAGAEQAAMADVHVRHPRKKCPICRGDYHALERSFFVCRIHESWLVTRCSVCGRAGFSDAAGFCMIHGLAGGATELHFAPKNADPTNYLKRIGQQGQAMRGF